MKKNIVSKLRAYCEDVLMLSLLSMMQSLFLKFTPCHLFISAKPADSILLLGWVEFKNMCMLPLQLGNETSFSNLSLDSFLTLRYYVVLLAGRHSPEGHFSH